MRPRADSTMRLQDIKPSPVPLALVVKNGVNNCPRVASSMPVPSSDTRSTTYSWPSAATVGVADSVSCPPRSAMAWMPLRHRLIRHCWNSV